MDTHPSNAESAIASQVLAGGGEMGAVMRSIDWRATPLGPVDEWPQTLRMMVRFLLANRFPLLLWWGPDYIQLYNDPYRPVLGIKHPRSMGQPGRECWPEIWHIIGPLVDTPFHGGPATWMEDIALEINRHGYMEETHYTIAYSPVPDENAPRGICAVLATVHEITQKVVGERRVGILRDLGARSLVEAQSADGMCAMAAEILARHPLDIPFALLYLIDREGARARLVAASGAGMGEPVSPLTIGLDDPAAVWPVRDAVRAERMEVVAGLQDRFERVPPGPWSDPPHTAVVLPIPSSMPHRPAGALVVGVSARLALDENYRGFLELLTAQVAAAVRIARAYEEERQRAEALAELDRAKTQFFSNVSHEFRTPLTLLLGPLEDALERQSEMAPAMHEALDMVHRNALRLLKLVNTLLEFSRIEAGRLEVVYERMDLASFTAELASSFRSAVERAGLRLVVDAPPLGDFAYADRDAWEKIVLNLLSNAFKHTFEGEIIVGIHARGRDAVLTVRDTGVGIPADQLPRVFERFHRVPNARSRTHEGTGIGLALVQELVRLHGGQISAESEEGVGSTFTVRVPLGAAHLPSDRIGASRRQTPAVVRAMPYVEEALGWLPDTQSLDHPPATGGADAFAAPAIGGVGVRGSGARILVADDNADMRAYVARLLQSQWAVEAVCDGAEALAAAKSRRPALVLADVMMPRLDGFQLLRALRDDAATRDIPVILLSARAGEESRVEGLNAGADDYLVKPFAARELIARVGGMLALADLRRQADHELRAARDDAEAARKEAESANKAKSEFLAAMSHELRTPLNAIGGHIQLLEMGLYGEITDEQRVALGRVRRSEKHLLSLITDVLNFAKLEAGRLEYQMGPVPLAAVVADVASMIEPQIAAKALAYDVRVDRGVAAWADREKVQQILINLLSNAVKFTDAGGRITVETPRGDDAGASGPAILQVTDTGPGIPADKQAAIFEPFVQLHRDVARAEGTGLGLAISRDLARGMGGDLQVRSAEGGGSTFVLSLPRQPR